jgi:hypothetical protein
MVMDDVIGSEAFVVMVIDDAMALEHLLSWLWVTLLVLEHLLSWLWVTSLAPQWSCVEPLSLLNHWARTLVFTLLFYFNVQCA